MSSVPRPGSSLVAFWAVAGIAIVFVGDAVLSADSRLALASVAPAALAVWVAWLLLYRPQVRFDEAGLVVTNPLRVAEVPWGRVVSVNQRFQIVVELDDGSRVTCWGSPFPEKPGLRRPPARNSSERPVRGSAESLESVRSSARPSVPESPVVRHWDRIAVVVGGVILIACLLELALVL